MTLKKNRILDFQAVAFGSALDQMMVAKEYKKFRPDVSGCGGGGCGQVPRV